MAAIPMFLGSDEVSGMFLGVDELQEMYLGTDLVYQSGPFEGIKIKPKTVQFFPGSLTASIKVKASEQWYLTTPAWVSASVSTGDTGETIVTLTATTQTATTTDTITVTSANYSASATVAYYVVEELAYIQNGTASTRNSNYLIDTNYVPTLNTTVEISLSVEDWDGNSIFSTDRIEGGWWRFFTYQNRNYFMDCPRDSSARVSIGATLNTQSTIKMWLADGNAYIQNGEGTPNSKSMPQVPNFTTSLKLWGGTWDSAERTKIYFIKLYESGVLTMNLIPAKIGSDVGLFDTIGGVLYTNLRSGVLTYGELSQ